MLKMTGIRNSYVEVFKKFAQNTRQHVIRNQVKNPKSPYSGALKTMLKLSQRSETLQGVQTLSKSTVNKISCFSSIGKWVFWNPCFTTDCREVYIYRRFCSQLQPTFKCPQIQKYKRYSHFEPQVLKIIVYTLVYIISKNNLSSSSSLDDVINLSVFKT